MQFGFHLDNQGFLGVCFHMRQVGGSLIEREKTASATAVGDGPQRNEKSSGTRLGFFRIEQLSLRGYLHFARAFAPARSGQASHEHGSSLADGLAETPLLLCEKGAVFG